MRKPGRLLAGFVLATMLAGCGASRHVQPYSGRLYSIAQVQGAFAALGLRLHTDSRHPGLTVLVNNHHLGQPYMGAVPRFLTVVVADRRHATASPASLRERYRSRLTRYANVTVFYKPSVIDEVRGSISTLRWGTPDAKPGRQLIVPGGSIGGIRLGESRKDVEQAFGPGLSMRHGLIRSYFGEHVLLTYVFHDSREKWVAGPLDAVARLSHALGRPRRVEQTGVAPYLRDLRQQSRMPSPGGAVAGRVGNEFRAAQRQGRRDRHRQLLTG